MSLETALNRARLFFDYTDGILLPFLGLVKPFILLDLLSLSLTELWSDESFEELPYLLNFLIIELMLFFF